MGGGSSQTKPKKPAQENLQQPLSTTNRTHVTQPRLSITDLPSNSSRQSFTKMQPPSQQTTRGNEQPLALNSGRISNRIRSPVLPNGIKSPRKVNMLPNGTNPTVLSYSQNNDSDDEQVAPVNNIRNRLNTNSTLASSLPSVKPVRTTTNASANRLGSINGKTSPGSTEQNGRCSFCPHCQQQSRVINRKASISPQPVWIMNVAPSKDHQHILMDHYDEEAVRKKLIKEYGHVPGSYDYTPHLTIEEEKNNHQISSRYYTLPAVVKSGSSFTPACTPFPNYDILQRYEKQLNKPYTQTLFTD